MKLGLDFGSSPDCYDGYGRGSNLGRCRLMSGPFKLQPALGSVSPTSTSIVTNWHDVSWMALAPSIAGGLAAELNISFDVGVLTDHCLRLHNSYVGDRKDANGFWSELQGVVYSKY